MNRKPQGAFPSRDRLASAEAILRMLVEAANDDKLEDFSKTSNIADMAADFLRGAKITGTLSRSTSVDRQLLTDLAVALDAWTHTFASEMCDEFRVAGYVQVITEGGGTLAYIADLRQRVRVAISAIKEPNAQADTTGGKHG